MINNMNKKSNIIILKGIYPKDFNQNLTIIGKITHDQISYTDIPKRFISKETWPEYTNLKCWGCDEIPQSYPKFIPVNPVIKDNMDTCDVLGNFCEWNCAVRYVTKEFSKEQLWDTLQYVCLFESKFSNSKKEKILPSPPKTILKEYCGSSGITRKQFKERIQTINSNYELTTYKLEHF
jgi:hypothetical protein